MKESRLEKILKWTASIALPIALAGTLAYGKLINKTTPLDIKNVHITSQVDQNMASTSSKNAKFGQNVNLHAIIEASQGDSTFYLGTPDSADIHGKKVFPQKWNHKYGDLGIQWSKVEPKKTFFPENITPSYQETLQDCRQWEIPLDVSPTQPLEHEVESQLEELGLIKINNSPDLGTMRYKLKINYDDSTYSTPGKESTDKFGIKDNVHRISLRKDDTELGWAYAWMNLPYIWGARSTNDQSPPEHHQTERFIAQDCADLMVGAARFSGKKHLPYTWSYGLINHSNTIAKVEDIDDHFNFLNKKGEFIRYGDQPGQVKIGDKLLSTRHVGFLAQDSGPYGEPDGILNGYDVMFHTLFNSPKEIYLCQHPPQKILRWKN
ncbi:hypothetical protein CMI37_20190 [Candidatus Pacearchaeota archaeon]|nr:hypothetical protein [Candidatus Pacearchaeota archaeon]|tara:strand:- start:4173 stop:5309 length:1137 start_codon:yes stop_codon:yes gene_type:complete